MNQLQTFDFNGNSLVAYEHADGTPLFSIQQVSAALEYKSPRSLGDLLRKSPEFREGTDYFVLAIEPSGSNPLGSSKHASSLTFLTLDCLRIVAMRTNSRLGAAFRRWIVDVVFPAFEARAPAPTTSLDLRGLTVLLAGALRDGLAPLAERVAALEARATMALPAVLPEVPAKSVTGRTLAATYGVAVREVNTCAKRLRATYDGVFGVLCRDDRFAGGVYAYSPSEAAEIVRTLGLPRPSPLGPVGEVFAK